MMRLGRIWITIGVAVAGCLVILRPPKNGEGDTDASVSLQIDTVRVQPTAGQIAARRAYPTLVEHVSRTRLTALGIESVPIALAADGSRVFFATADGALLAVRRMTHSVLWMRSSSELGVVPRQLVLLDDERLLVLSGPEEPLVRLDRRRGRIDARWASPTPSLMQGGCGRSDGVLLTSADTGASLIYVDSGGVMRGRANLPWRWLERAHPLQRQIAATRDHVAQSCALALMSGAGFALLSDHGRLRLQTYLDQVDIGAVEVRRRIARDQIVTEARFLGTYPVSDVAASAGRLFVSGPAVPEGWIVVDIFSSNTGAYHASLRLPHPVRRFTATGDDLLVVTYEHGYPVLLEYRLRRNPHGI
jgi:hypothetical protein